MELDKLNKNVHITKTARGAEMLYAGFACLSIQETAAGYFWQVNPFFAKMTYGANVFNDLPVCIEATPTIESAIAIGLSKLNDLGAFKAEITLPEDTYVAAHLTESADQIDELSDVVKHSYVAKAARNRDDLEDRLQAIADSGAKVDTHKIENKLSKREKTMQHIVSHIPKEVAYSIKEDCRAEALKHSDSLMEAHDLAEGLFESFVEELDEVKSDVVTTHDKEKSINTAKTAQGKKSLYKQIAQSQKEPKTNQWKVKESVEELDESYSMHGSGSDFDSAAFDRHMEKLRALSKKSETEQAVAKMKRDDEEAERKKKEKRNDASDSDRLITDPFHPSQGVNIRTEAYGATKKAYDPFASAIAKVMSRPAFSAVPKDEPEPVAPKKKNGRPTNIDLDMIKSKAKENLKAGKRPTAGMERNEKIHFIRHLKDHPDFAGTHVSKAGRTVGTTKSEMEKRKETIKAQKIDNVFTSWGN